MSATILPFPRQAGAMRIPPLTAGQTRALTQDWSDQHLPLIDAALDLLQTDEDEFRARCEAIAEEEGPTVLRQLVTRIEQLGSHVGDVVEALTMTAVRIRSTMAMEA